MIKNASMEGVFKRGELNPAQPCSTLLRICSAHVSSPPAIEIVPTVYFLILPRATSALKSWTISRAQISILNRTGLVTPLEPTAQNLGTPVFTFIWLTVAGFCFRSIFQSDMLNVSNPIS
jgi:hypothetical protein